MTDQSVIATLEAALGSADPAKRQSVLNHVTDLFVSGSNRYSSDQIALFDEVLLKLSRDIEVKARRRLAQRLAPLEHAPAKTVQRLARDPSPAVASPILRHVLQLADCDIIAVASSGSEAHLFALSGRKDLGEDVTDIIVDRAGRRATRSLAGNADAKLSDESFGKLVHRAENDETLASAVGVRRDIPRRHFIRLVANASAAVRVKLAAADPALAREIGEVVGDLVGDIGRASRIASGDPDLAKAEMARLMHPERSGDVDTAAAARARKIDQAATALSLLGRVPRDVAERALAEDKPDMLLIIAKVGGCSWKSLKGMLRIQNGDRDLDIDDLLRLRADYERLQLGSAQQVLVRYRTRSAAEATG